MHYMTTFQPGNSTLTWSAGGLAGASMSSSDSLLQTGEKSQVPALRWRRHWRGAQCQNRTIGLIDGDPGTDLDGEVCVRRFTNACDAQACEHARYSVALLRGHTRSSGRAHGARLKVAAVVGDDGTARPAAVAAAYCCSFNSAAYGMLSLA